MKMRIPKPRWAAVGASLAVIAAAAGVTLGVTTLLGVTFQGSGEPPEALPATPTVPPEIIANTVDDALRLSSGLFTGYGSTLTVAKPESVSYVETTVGQARALFDPDRPGGWELPDEAPAWAIVAYGEFKSGRPGVVDRTPVPYTTVWIVVLQGTELIYPGGSNERYDLSKLGTVVEVPESVWREYCVPGDRVDPDKCSPAP